MDWIWRIWFPLALTSATLFENNWSLFIKNTIWDGGSTAPKKVFSVLSSYKNIATGETSQAITPFHVFDNFHFFEYFHFFDYFRFFEYLHFFEYFHFFDYIHFFDYFHFFGSKKFFRSNKFIFGVKKVFWSKKFLGHKSFLGHKHPYPKLKNNWGPLSSTFRVEQSETLIAWKFESITNQLTDRQG